jgi:hypothetical protein
MGGLRIEPRSPQVLLLEFKNVSKVLVLNNPPAWRLWRRCCAPLIARTLCGWMDPRAPPPILEEGQRAQALETRSEHDLISVRAHTVCPYILRIWAYITLNTTVRLYTCAEEEEEEM